MQIKTAALIITAGKTRRSEGFEPMMKVGSVSAVRRLIKTFEQAGANPVAVAAGAGATSLRRHISGQSVICLENTGDFELEMIDFAKTGLAYLENRCDQVLLTPVDVPLFTVATAKKLMDCGAKLASPVSILKNGEKKSGHPLLISRELIPAVLGYNGDNGLRGAFSEQGFEREFIEVDDAGVLIDVEMDDGYEDLLKQHDRVSIHPEVCVSLVKETAFFDPDTAHLLSLIEETDSVRLACSHMGISYSKAWKLVNLMETQLGCRIVERQQGGKHGGGAHLTKRGKDILDSFYDFENACKSAARKLFDEHFK